MSPNALPVLHSKVEKVEEDVVLPPSYFPCLDARQATSKSWQSVEVPFGDINRLRSFCDEHDVPTTSVFQAAWALVLRCYLGNASVCFASRSSSTADEMRRLPEVNPDICVCQIDFQAVSSMADIFRVIMSRPLSPPRIYRSPLAVNETTLPVNLPLNTFLSCRQDESQDWSFADRPISWECGDSGGQAV